MSDEREFIPLGEVAKYVGIKRASLYYYFHALGITPQRFKFDKRAYITPTEMEKIKKIKEKPWLAGPRGESSR